MQCCGCWEICDAFIQPFYNTSRSNNSSGQILKVRVSGIYYNHADVAIHASIFFTYVYKSQDTYMCINDIIFHLKQNAGSFDQNPIRIALPSLKKTNIIFAKPYDFAVYLSQGTVMDHIIHVIVCCLEFILYSGEYILLQLWNAHEYQATIVYFCR